MKSSDASRIQSATAKAGGDMADFPARAQAAAARNEGGQNQPRTTSAGQADSGKGGQHRKWIERRQNNIFALSEHEAYSWHETNVHSQTVSCMAHSAHSLFMIIPCSTNLYHSFPQSLILLDQETSINHLSPDCCAPNDFHSVFTWYLWNAGLFEKNPLLMNISS